MYSKEIISYSNLTDNFLLKFVNGHGKGFCLVFRRWFPSFGFSNTVILSVFFKVVKTNTVIHYKREIIDSIERRRDYRRGLKSTDLIKRKESKRSLIHNRTYNQKIMMFKPPNFTLFK